MPTDFSRFSAFPGYGSQVDGPGHFVDADAVEASPLARREEDAGKESNISVVSSENGLECFYEAKRRGQADKIADMLADVHKFREKVSPGFFWQVCEAYKGFYSQLREGDLLAQNSATSTLARKEFLDWSDENMPKLHRAWEEFQSDKEGMLDAKNQRQRQQWALAIGIVVAVCDLAVRLDIPTVLGWSALVGD